MKVDDIVALKEALAKGANPNFINQNDEGGPTALHETVYTNNSDFVKELLECGACANITKIHTKNTPLHEGKTNCPWEYDPKWIVYS